MSGSAVSDPLAALSAAGVSVWLDDLSRELLAGGDLGRLIADKHVVGVTTNPTIFASALSEGDRYDDQLRRLGGGRDHTVVVLMGIGTLAHSAMVLAQGARGDDCPVAIVEDGYGANQRVTIGTLGTIAFQAAHRSVRSPAVVIVGDVVTLSPYAVGAFDQALPTGHPAQANPALTRNP